MALFSTCPAVQLAWVPEGRLTIRTCPGVSDTVCEKLGALTGYWTVTEVGTSLVSCTEAVTEPSGLGMRPTMNSLPLLSMTKLAASHWLVSRLQSGAQRSWPPPSPSDWQVAPRRSLTSHSSLGWFTTPSPQVGAAVQPMTLKLRQSAAQARAPAEKPCDWHVCEARSVPSHTSNGWLRRLSPQRGAAVQPEVFKVHCGLQARVPGPRPRLWQVAPAGTLPSQASPGLFTAPSPQ